MGWAATTTRSRPSSTQNPTFANRVDLDPRRQATTMSLAGPAWPRSPTTAANRTPSPSTWRVQYRTTPYNQLDTGPAQDERIQNQAFRGDTVLDNAAPLIAGDLATTVDEGESVVITTADLTEADPDHSGDNLTYAVTGTLNGDVLVNGVAATSFTQADLAAGLVSFEHDGSSSTTRASR